MLTVTPRDRSCTYRLFEGLLIGILAKAGAKLDAKDKLLEETPLHKALRHDMNENVLSLLHAGATVEAADARGDTVLHAAARHCKSVIVWAALLRGRGSNSVSLCNTSMVEDFNLFSIYSK